MSPKKNIALKKWIDQQVADNPPRAKSLVMTLFGDAITPHGGKVWLGSLIALLAPFGISDRLVRTSVYRLAEEGWLDARREGRRSRYALNPSAAPRFEHAYQRIYAPSYREWNGKWTFVFATSGTITAGQRAGLRKELIWQGFGVIAPSAFGHPSADIETLEDILRRVGVQRNAFVCIATDSPITGGRPLSELITQCWDLENVITDYDHLIRRFSGVRKMLAAGNAIDPEQAFVARTMLIHEYRRVQLHDPQLPLELLPKNWPGKTAYELCSQIYRETYKSAEQYMLEILRQEDDNAPEAAAYFYRRFGGLDRGDTQQ